jgi:hypothetical protein
MEQKTTVRRAGEAGDCLASMNDLLSSERNKPFDGLCITL